MNKRQMGIILVLLFLALCRIAVASDLPVFDSVGIVSLEGSFPAHADPAVLMTDWDGDGLTDMLAAVYHGDGNNSLTRIQYYKNEGTVTTPSFQYQADLKDVHGTFLTPHWY